MKIIALILCLVCLPASAAQHIQRASIDALMADPAALDVLMHAEIWVFKSSTDGNYYTAIRALVDEPSGGVTRECLLWRRGTTDFGPLIPRFHRYTMFYTNGVNMDPAMLDWCIG